MKKNKRTNVRLLALDLDGTTLRSDGCLSAYSKDALMDAHRAGIQIVVASGRSYASLPEEIKALPCVEYAITSNGAVVYDMKNQRPLRTYYLQAEAVRKILQIADEAGVMVEGFLDGIPYSQWDYVEDPVRFGTSQEAAAYVKQTRRPTADIHAFLLAHEERLESLDFIVGNLEQKEALRTRIQSEVSGVYLTSAVPVLLEVSDFRSGKASGLRMLSEYLNIPRQETAAFGNAENDLDMMEWAGYSVAVANAPKEVRMLANETTASNDEDGVGRWVRKYLEEQGGQDV